MTQSPSAASTAQEPAPRLGPAGRAAVGLFGLVGLVLILIQTFNVEAFGVFPLLANRYYYLLIGLFLAAAFLLIPARPGRAAGLVDWALAALSLCAGGFLGWNAEAIITGGWDVVAPHPAVVVSALLVLLSLEAVRRAGGTILLVICALFAAYPLFADQMPGFLWGPRLSFSETVAAHAMGMESIIGIPLRVVADTLVGFIIFGSVLNTMGGGQFFMDLSLALMGRSRGGPAKVAILSSALFGSLSGSVISNVLTTGRLTIPSMQRAGYPARYAAAVEACASTGGTLMPPVMGAVAFIMASFLDTPYTTIMIAAAVPSALFYLALLLQVDLFAARAGLSGAERDQFRPLGSILAGGWHHIVSLVALVLMLFVLTPARAAYYATALMLVMGLLRHRRLPETAAARALLDDVTANIAQLVATLCGIGLVVGSLAITGVGSAFSRELILYGGHNVFLLLVLGALTSFVLGMGMTVSACYIFLATVLAPALTGLGLPPIGAHLFVLYWGMLSYITPPVALASITAAQISGARGLDTGFTSMRLGAVLFILPFMFVFDPALLLEGDWLQILRAIALAVLSVVAISCALEAWLYRVGRIGPVERAGLLAAGLLILAPLPGATPVGALLLAAATGLALLRQRSQRAVQPR
ncbi:TRAP transporter permease [Acidimangrovimonas pyrenivorans]|uniref:TRAP transporter permease n=1 Tax=Acidimangrovimonas pyrenivorans TaxID=2030798 RepID=A0ABV7AK72_9RHOB